LQDKNFQGKVKNQPSKSKKKNERTQSKTPGGSGDQNRGRRARKERPKNDRGKNVGVLGVLVWFWVAEPGY
jgi:hypothetical protein